MSKEFKMTYDVWRVTQEDLDRAWELTNSIDGRNSHIFLNSIVSHRLDEPLISMTTIVGRCELIKHRIVFGFWGNAAYGARNTLGRLATGRPLERADFNRFLDASYRFYFLNEPFDLNDNPKYSRFVGFTSMVRNHEMALGEPYPNCPRVERQVRRAYYPSLEGQVCYA